jgi:succinate dehydrogenase/fumarate reductase flavoprotein subunit
MMLEIWKELNSGKGPVQLKMTHLDEDTIAEIESILWANERPSRQRFHQGRNEDYRTHGVEMHISEIGLCSGHSASGVWVNENAQTTVPGLYAAGDMASVPHNYMIGAFVFGRIAGTHAIEYIQDLDFIEPDAEFLAAEKARIYAPLTRPNSIPHTQVEYKLRRLVNDYLQPPKSGNKIEIGLKHFIQYQQTLDLMGARDPHELMRCIEVHFIRDCAEMAARASLYRQETRWGLYHYRLDYPEKNDDEWFCHVNLKKDESGQMILFKRPVDPYIVEVDTVKESYNVAVR